jgi:hypothetical protein
LPYGFIFLFICLLLLTASGGTVVPSFRQEHPAKRVETGEKPRFSGKLAALRRIAAASQGVSAALPAIALALSAATKALRRVAARLRRLAVALHQAAGEPRSVAASRGQAALTWWRMTFEPCGNHVRGGRTKAVQAENYFSAGETPGERLGGRRLPAEKENRPQAGDGVMHD